MNVCYFGIDLTNVINTKVRQKCVLNLYLNYLTLIINIVLVMKWGGHLCFVWKYKKKLLDCLLRFSWMFSYYLSHNIDAHYKLLMIVLGWNIVIDLNLPYFFFFNLYVFCIFQSYTCYFKIMYMPIMWTWLSQTVFSLMLSHFRALYSLINYKFT